MKIVILALVALAVTTAVIGKGTVNAVQSAVTDRQTAIAQILGE